MIFTGPIENWLQHLVEGMQSTMRSVISDAHKAVYGMGVAEFILAHPAQVALLGLQFQWTSDVQVGSR